VLGTSRTRAQARFASELPFFRTVSDHRIGGRDAFQPVQAPQLGGILPQVRLRDHSERLKTSLILDEPATHRIHWICRIGVKAISPVPSVYFWLAWGGEPSQDGRPVRLQPQNALFHGS
jgi:hypothetical protein